MNIIEKKLIRFTRTAIIISCIKFEHRINNLNNNILVICMYTYSL